MPAQQILLLGDPLLWKTSAPVEDIQSRETHELIEDLGATLSSFRQRQGFGRAIAAPQIGVHRRVIFMNVGRPAPLLNPEISWQGAEEFELWDDCFSFPDLMVRVRRKVEVKVRYTDEHGAPQELLAKNDLAELLQHEIDHLDGILATDRAIDPRAFALRSEVLRRGS